MISLSLFLLAAASSGGSVVEVPAGDRLGTEIQAAAPIRVWLNNSRQFREGERAQVQVETDEDGYLVVFNYDTDGRLRVIFPVDPRDDNFVRGGRRYEIRGRGDRESFIVGQEGEGTVYAAVSADPFRFDEIESGGNWDYGRVDFSRDSRDPEADITDLLQRMASDRGFDYDVLTYQVYDYHRGGRYVSTWLPRPYGYWDDYYCDPYYRPSLFGCRYYPVNGWYLGYSPYRYGYYGYRSWWYDPFYRNRYTSYYPHRNYPVVAGRPRGYTIVRRGSGPSGSTGRFGSWGGSVGGNNRARPGIDYRPRAGRPSDGGDRGRPSGSAGGRPSNRSGDARPSSPSRGDRPRARRSPPSEEIRPAIERERPGTGRGSVDFGGDGRRSVSPDAPRRDDTRARRSGGEDGFDGGRSVSPDSPRRDDTRARRSGREDGFDGGRSVSPDAPRRDDTRARRSGSEDGFDGRRSVDAPRREDVPARRSGGDDGPRYERPRAEPRSQDRYQPRDNDRRSEPRASAPARSEPRQAPPPRAEPRHSAPRSEPSRPRSSDRPRDGGGGGRRGRP